MSWGAFHLVLFSSSISVKQVSFIGVCVWWSVGMASYKSEAKSLCLALTDLEY